MNTRPKHVGEGLVCDERGVVTPPRIVIDHHHAGHAVIPIGLSEGREKFPLDEWKEYQERQPTIDEVRGWIQRHGRDIAGWARVTGARAGVIVIDFDGAAAESLHEWGLAPHVLTGSGGYHLIVRHPGWPVKTCNSRSSKKHFEHYPNVDIRADGGYSLIAGFESRGGYEWLRDFQDVDELDVLPEAFRRFFGLWEAPEEKEEAPRPAREVVRIGGGGKGPTPEHLVERALEEAALSGRNNGGHWLAQQLHDHGYERAEILEVGQQYVARCPGVNMKGNPEPYTLDDFRRTADQVVARPRRDRWGDGEADVMADFGEQVRAAGGDEEGDGLNIDLYLVPTEIGAEEEYPDWAIEDLVREGSRVILYGESGAAKSYAAVDLARAAVTGGTWLGKRVLPGSVIYIAAEDYLGIHHRTEATIRHGGVRRAHRVRVFERSLPLTNHADVKLFLKALDYLPEKPRYVIVDNLSLCMGDGDPNEGVAAKAFVDGCQLFQSYRWREEEEDPKVRATDAVPITVIVIHHTNKAGNFNGSQYFKNFVDAQSELVWDGKGLSRVIYGRKQRQGSIHGPLPFDLVEVDPERKLCVIQSTARPEPQSGEEKAWRNLLPQEEQILTCLREADLERLLRLGDELDEVPRGLERADITVRSGVHPRSVGRFLNALKAAGFTEPVLEEVEDSRGHLKLKKVFPERIQLTDGGRDVVDRGFEGVRIRGRLPGQSPGRPKKGASDQPPCQNDE